MEKHIENFLLLLRQHMSDAAAPDSDDRPQYSHMPLRRTLRKLRPEDDSTEQDILEIILTTQIIYNGYKVDPLLWYRTYCHDIDIPVEVVAKMFCVWYRDQESCNFPLHKYPYHQRLHVDSSFLINLELAPMLFDFCKGIKLYDAFYILRDYQLDIALTTTRPKSLNNPCDDALLWLFEFHRLPSIMNLRGKPWEIQEFSCHFKMLIAQEDIVTAKVVPLVYRYRKEEEMDFKRIQSSKTKQLPRLIAMYVRFEHWQKDASKAGLFNDTILFRQSQEVIDLFYEHRPTRGRHVCYDIIYYHAAGNISRKGITPAVFKLDEFVRYYREQENNGFSVVVKPFEHLSFLEFLDELMEVFNPYAFEGSCLRLLVEQRRLLGHS